MEDLEPLFKIISHPEVWQYDPGYLRTLEDTRNILAFRIQEIKTRGIGRLAMVEKETKGLVGYCGLQLCLIEDTRFRLPSVEMFYGLGREFWGKGYTTEAARALLNFGFEKKRLPRIICCAVKENLRSIAVMRRVGMEVAPDPVFPHRYVIGSIENPEF